ncbi:dihydroorotate dehydrogenase (NAD+) catalytic subunit [Spiroplasma gladiatoris]|uniref:Dihydroorotate dehydrogenase n=1 Tax=Spiroplasma gladiatoris TaxID=2143 RepID=A0A4V1AQA2_9MOLU|nr:dihydroorotate dehydrogenase [Spiroplasma gladiatoris]QBQ07789.1 dihydroorotate dehydrogenase (NAD+) catalytic subunit [Spiroplasma gladiatoris]
MDTKLKTKVAQLFLKNPITIASGPFVHGEYLETFHDLDILGAITTKTVTFNPRKGNQSPRLVEIENGYINSVGLKNVGIKRFIEMKIPFIEEMNVPTIVSIAGESKEEYVRMVEMLNPIECVSAIEINVSCPNVQNKSIIFESDVEGFGDLLKSIRNVCKKPLFVKISNNNADVVTTAKICKEQNIDAVVLLNSPSGMSLNLNSGQSNLPRQYGGMSGKILKPVALKVVDQVSNAVDIPIIGVGGISNTDDVIEMLLAGASAVGIGSAIMWDPLAAYKMVINLEKDLQKYNYNSVEEIILKVKQTRQWYIESQKIK